MTKLSKKHPQANETITQADSKNTVDKTAQSTNPLHWPFDNGHFAPFHSLRKEVDDIFNQFTDRLGVFSRNADDKFQMPALDVDETDTAFEISAEMPGVAEDDIDISVTENTLKIYGKKHQSTQSETADRRISECSYGVYERSLSLPFQCSAKSIQAKYDNGVLHLTVPKPKDVNAKPQKVKIKKAA